MFPDQPWRIQQELNKLKRLRQSEVDQQQQQQLELRIQALEQQLQLLSQQKRDKAAIHISQVEAGRDITVGGEHHHYYPEAPKKSHSHWWKIMLGSIAPVLFFLWGIHQWSQQPATPSPAETTVSSSERLVFPDSTIRTDSGQVTALITAQQTADTSKSVKRPVKAQSFWVTSPSPKVSLRLKEGLLKTTNWQSSVAPETDFRIEVGYSGTPKPVHQQLYRYREGYLQISINGLLCCCDEEPFKISLGESRYGNPLYLIEERIIDTMYQQIHQHLEDVIFKIKNCAM